MHRRKKIRNPLESATSEAGAHDPQQLLAAIVESSDDAIIGKNLDGTINAWNKSAERIFGYTKNEIIGKSILTIIPPELHFEESEIMQKLRAGERVVHYETRRLRKDGQIVHVSITVSPICDASGRVIGASKIARDISDLKRTERALLESEKLAAAGRTAAIIAHEINNPLEAITNLAYLISVNQSLNEEARTYVDMLLKEISRVSLITKQTLSFFRNTPSITDVSLSELLDEVLELYRAKITEKDLRIVRKYNTPSVVRGSAPELRQVFANLLINAIEAVPPKGTVCVRVNSCGRDWHRDGHCVRVTIADDGKGIPINVRPHLFEPFFTTKSGNGTGLGLWVSKGIIQKHGGSIHVRSRVGSHDSGTLFSVILPRNTESDAQIATLTA